MEGAQRPSFDSDEETAAGSDYSDDFRLLEKSASPLSAQHTCSNCLLSLSMQLPNSAIFLTTLAKYARLLGLALLPSFIRSRIYPNSTSQHSSKSSIAALDGLRGLACLFVFNEHFTYNYTHAFLYGYGVEDHHTLIQLPFLRIPWSGFSMVAIFFVISGYVLSYKPLKLVRAKEAAAFHQTLTSSVFRRALRLYLPSMLAVILTGLFSWAGTFDRASDIFRSEQPQLFELHEATPPRYDTFYVQISDAIKNAFVMTYFWRWDMNTTPGDYDLHLWTIPTEFRASMVLFLTLIATSRLRQKWRFIYLAVFGAYCIGTNRRDVLLFLAGMTLAEIDLIRHERRLTLSIRPARRSTLFWLCTFISGLYLICIPPIGAEYMFGFRTLVRWTNHLPHDGEFFGYQGAILQCFGAALIAWTAANSTSLAPLFTNPVSQYLGQISYALYLVHGNVLKSLFYTVMPWIADVTGGFGTANQWGTPVLVGSTAKLIMAWVLGLVIVLPSTIWAADLFWRGIDVPVVGFARWVEKQWSEDWEEEHGRVSEKTG